MDIKTISANSAGFKTGAIEVTKGFGSLLIACDETYDKLTTETITIKVEKANGSDEYIAQDILLKDFLALSVYGGNALFADRAQVYEYVADCALTKNGGSIELAEGEKIVISMDNLKLKTDGVTPTTYKLNGFEEALPSRDFYYFDRKSIHADAITHDLNVEGYDLISLQDDASITEVALTYENGRRCVYTRFELDTMAAMVDPVSRIDMDGYTYSYFDGRIVFPLRGVTGINLRKTAGTRLEVHLRTENEYILT